MRLGPHELASNLFLSPLAGYTNLPMRLTLRELGGLGWATTDLVNARSLLERNRRALQLIQTGPADRPLAVQLFGSVPAEMREAALLLEALGIDSVDVNMGCPVRKVTRIGGGSAMMTELRKSAALVRGMVEAVKIPVTAKMRLGWDAENLTAPELARALEDAGVAAVFIHGRTRAQGFGGAVNLAGIRGVVGAVRHIPVIGNGDVTTPAAARKMLDATGCAGIGIGRGAFYNPWIFRQTELYLRTGEAPAEPSFEERVRVMVRHLDLMTEVFGEEIGCRMFRKVAVWYAKRFGPAVEFRRRVAVVRSRADFDEALAAYRQWRARFCDARGELLPKYRPGKIPGSLQDDAIGRAPPAIPVPRGPVETW
jgi:nifR3 family TIM-barrel protein